MGACVPLHSGCGPEINNTLQSLNAELHLLALSGKQKITRFSSDAEIDFLKPYHLHQ